MYIYINIYIYKYIHTYVYVMFMSFIKHYLGLLIVLPLTLARLYVHHKKWYKANSAWGNIIIKRPASFP